MSERPIAQRALFDRVGELFKTSAAETPGSIEDVAALSDLDAALALCVVLAADLDYATSAPSIRCGHCMTHDAKTAALFATNEEVQAHIVACPYNPLVRAVVAALNAIDTLGAMALDSDRPPAPTAAEQETEVIAYATIDALRRMVGR